MQLINTLKLYKEKWWGLPLLLPFVLLPFARYCSTLTWVNDAPVILYFLPLSLITTLLLFYGWAALPGIVLSLVVNYYSLRCKSDLLITVIHFLVPTLLSWGGYRVFATRTAPVSGWYSKAIGQRLFWLVFVNATLFMLFYQFSTFFGLYDQHAQLMGENPFTLLTLVNYQAVLVGCLTGIPLFSLIIRLTRHPRYFYAFISQMRAQCDKRVTKVEAGIWLSLLAGLLLLLLLPLSPESSIFSTSYSLSLLLPLMLWGAMRFGYFLVISVWTPLLILLCHYFYRYFPTTPNYDFQLVINSSSYGIFSLVIIFMALTATRQRFVHQRGRRLALVDPLFHLPNLRALSRDLADTPWSILCFMRIPELDLLGRNYGLMLRVYYKQRMAAWLRDVMEPGELAYQLSGHDMVLRLRTESHPERIDRLAQHIKQFRFMWDGMPLQPQVGISYSFVRSPVTHLHLLLGEMSTMADLSLTSNRPESMQDRGANHVQQAVKSKVEMLNQLQNALDNNQFVLMAQPIAGMRGDDYYEVLLRMQSQNGERVLPERFLPVAQEFGLSSRIDLMVLENTLAFMAQWREKLPGSRFAVNLTTSSLCRTLFPNEVQGLLARYQIEPWQLIFEITESSSLTNYDQTHQNVQRLRAMGCRIAIDDFGTGYASYARLKNIDADIMKIDGSFIRNLAASSLDYQIVESMCRLARMKKMQIVAEYVENEATAALVRELGIDYLQGFLIGHPQPLETLVANK
ncbi:EAL domain-containing protein [Franconibacter helveticus 513]|uniref:sensor domain-containing phosphodiesterase n=1 Tax=Franconibacter helveticus TaxID=357240 RepID=UPI0004053CC8|nr:EAL domain-containing protein [Franconibacter helveticus]